MAEARALRHGEATRNDEEGREAGVQGACEMRRSGRRCPVAAMKQRRKSMVVAA